jgi:hypothetical protein
MLVVLGIAALGIMVAVVAVLIGVARMIGGAR